MPGKKNLRMKAARAAVGLSQTDLAEAVGVTRQTIGLIEAGGYNPTLNLCVAICKTLHVTLNDLFWEDDGDINTNPFFF
ncbi:helix-turn-helix transcriptional regulator [uncultured Slackia sp.]|uniref:helix-turn-helix transcriptional regulator n=1 Tax=uncultured Slackia sp. TaxID=665903 RepID=UPI0025896EDF|nr:helix-turn-helix transcriptional regulator [uncultured Slackia sp.]